MKKYLLLVISLLVYLNAPVVYAQIPSSLSISGGIIDFCRTKSDREGCAAALKDCLSEKGGEIWASEADLEVCKSQYTDRGPAQSSGCPTYWNKGENKCYRNRSLPFVGCAWQYFRETVNDNLCSDRPQAQPVVPSAISESAGGRSEPNTTAGAATPAPAPPAAPQSAELTSGEMARSIINKCGVSNNECISAVRACLSTLSYNITEQQVQACYNTYAAPESTLRDTRATCKIQMDAGSPDPCPQINGGNDLFYCNPSDQSADSNGCVKYSPQATPNPAAGGGGAGGPAAGGRPAAGGQPQTETSAGCDGVDSVYGVWDISVKPAKLIKELGDRTPNDPRCATNAPVGEQRGGVPREGQQPPATPPKPTVTGIKVNFNEDVNLQTRSIKVKVLNLCKGLTADCTENTLIPVPLDVKITYSDGSSKHLTLNLKPSSRLLCQACGGENQPCCLGRSQCSLDNDNQPGDKCRSGLVCGTGADGRKDICRNQNEVGPTGLCKVNGQELKDGQTTCDSTRNRVECRCDSQACVTVKTGICPGSTSEGRGVEGICDQEEFLNGHPQRCVQGRYVQCWCDSQGCSWTRDNGPCSSGSSGASSTTSTSSSGGKGPGESCTKDSECRSGNCCGGPTCSRRWTCD